MTFDEFVEMAVPDILPCPEVHPDFMYRGERWNEKILDWESYGADIQCRLPLGHGTEHEGSQFAWSTRTRT